PDQMQLSCFPYRTQISYFNTRRKPMKSVEAVHDCSSQKDLSSIEEELLSFIQGQEAASRTYSPSCQSIVERGVQQARPQIDAVLFHLLADLQTDDFCYD